MFYLVCSDINERYDIEYPSITSMLELFCITYDLGVSGFSYRIFLSLRARNSMNFLPICKILVSKII